MIEKSDLHEFKISLFDNGEPREFSFFVSNFNKPLAASGTFETFANIQYLHMVFLGKKLRQFYLLSSEM